MNELTNDTRLRALTTAEAAGIGGGEDVMPRYDDDGNIIGTCTEPGYPIKLPYSGGDPLHPIG
jgi:hypothetical protein